MGRNHRGRRTIVPQQSRPLLRIGLKYLNYLNGFHCPKSGSSHIFRPMLRRTTRVGLFIDSMYNTCRYCEIVFIHMYTYNKHVRFSSKDIVPWAKEWLNSKGRWYKLDLGSLCPNCFPIWNLIHGQCNAFFQLPKWLQLQSVINIPSRPQRCINETTGWIICVTGICDHFWVGHLNN